MIRAKYTLPLMVPMTAKANYNPRRGDCDLEYQTHNTKALSVLKILCASFDRDGLAYEVAYNLDGDSPNIIVTAHGQTKRPKQAKRTFSLPARLTAEQCRKRIATPGQQIPGDNTPHNVWLADERDFWREMESLAETREQYKPGLFPEDYYRFQPREVAA